MDPKQYIERFKLMSNGTKMASLAALAAVLGIAALVSRGPEAGPYQYLYTGLDAHDGGEIVAKLKEKRVPYKIEGGAISVPESAVHELRLEMAQAGLPRGGGVGFEIFDRPSYGQSDFVQQKNYLRALQGELERTIASIGAVQQARVHLVMPERRLFRDNEEPASASVVVKLRPGRALGEGQAQGIVHVVSSSVPGLQAERVTLLDDSGQVLSTTGDKLGGLANSSLDYKRKIEKSYEQKVRQILERAVGVGKASVQVAAEIDFNSSEKTEESFDPERTVVRSEQSNEEHTENQGGMQANAGVPGTRSNLPGGAKEQPASQPVGASTSADRRNATKNYEVSKTVHRTVSAPGRLMRLNVAVIVDGAYDKEGKFIPRDDGQMESLAAVVKQAMGFDTRRGDQFELRCVPFANEALESAPETTGVAALLNKTNPTVLLGGLGAGAVLLFAIGFLLARRGKAANLPALLPGGMPRTLREVEATLDGGTLRAVGATPHAAAGGALSPQDVQAMVMQDANKAATVLRGWLQK